MQLKLNEKNSCLKKKAAAKRQRQEQLAKDKASARAAEIERQEQLAREKAERQRQLEQRREEIAPRRNVKSKND